MQKLKIITDSVSDITKEEEKKLGIKVMNGRVSVDGLVYRDRLDFTNDQFYRMMDKAKEIPRIQPVPEADILKTFRGLHKEGWTDVIYITASSAGHDTYLNVLSAAEEFKRETEYSEDKPMKIYMVDSKSYSAAYGYPVTQAALMAQKGETPEKIIEYLKDCFESAEIIFLPMTLKYVKKSQKLSSVLAFAGELVGVRPIIKMVGDSSSIIAKVRGEKNIIPKLIEAVENNMSPQTPYILLRGSSTAAAEALEEKITELLGYPPERTVKIGAAISCNMGHNTLGIVYKGRKKS